MRKLVLVIATVVCFTGQAIAQPAPAPSPPPALPEAAPPAPAPEAAPPASAPEAAPPAPFGPPASFGPPSQLEPPGAAQPQPEPRARLSETTALSLSLFGTIGSWATLILGTKEDNGGVALLGLLGTLLTPNMGHWYRGVAVTRGTGLRLVGGALTFYGLIRVIGCEGGCSDADGYALYGGFLLYVVATIDDIVTAPLAVRKHNQRLEVIGVTPMVTNHSAGLALGGRF